MFGDSGGTPGPDLTPAEQAQAQEWAQKAREAIVAIFDSGKSLAPVPRNWEIESITISRTPHPTDPGRRAQNEIGSRASIGGREVQVGRITIYPPGARSFESVFIRLGHEIGHFFPEGTFTESQLTQYGTGLWNVHNSGGIYSGPRP